MQLRCPARRLKHRTYRIEKEQQRSAGSRSLCLHLDCTHGQTFKLRFHQNVYPLANRSAAAADVTTDSQNSGSGQSSTSVSTA